MLKYLYIIVMNNKPYHATDRSEHFNDGNKTADDVRWLSGYTHNAIGGLGAAHRKHFDFHAELLAHVSQLGTSFADDAARLTLMYQ